MAPREPLERCWMMLNDRKRNETKRGGNVQPVALLALPGETLVACRSRCCTRNYIASPVTINNLDWSLHKEKRVVLDSWR